MAHRYQDTLELVKRAAQEAASQGDPVKLFGVLLEEHALDGLMRRLKAGWSEIPDDEMEEIAADALEVLYYRMREGATITNAIGFIWKTAYFKCQEYHRLHAHFEKVSIDMLDETTDLGGTELGDLEARERLRIEAIRQARSLVPLLRSANIQTVMSYVIDAVEKGLPDVSNQEIAEALHMEVKTVKNCLHRGFERLSRIAKEQGMTSGALDLLQPATDLDYEDERERGGTNAN